MNTQATIKLNHDLSNSRTHTQFDIFTVLCAIQRMRNTCTVHCTHKCADSDTTLKTRQKIIQNSAFEKIHGDTKTNVSLLFKIYLYF